MAGIFTEKRRFDRAQLINNQRFCSQFADTWRSYVDSKRLLFDTESASLTLADVHSIFNEIAQELPIIQSYGLNEVLSQIIGPVVYPVLDSETRFYLTSSFVQNYFGDDWHNYDCEKLQTESNVIINPLEEEDFVEKKYNNALNCIVEIAFLSLNQQVSLEEIISHGTDLGLSSLDVCILLQELCATGRLIPAIIHDKVSYHYPSAVIYPEAN